MRAPDGLEERTAAIEERAERNFERSELDELLADEANDDPQGEF